MHDDTTARPQRHHMPLPSALRTCAACAVLIAFLAAAMTALVLVH